MRNVFIGLLFVALPGLHATSIFNFDKDVQGKSTAFTDVNNGISAAFSSSRDPGGFQVEATFFKSLTGNVLLEPGTAGIDGLSLAVGFSKQLSSISLNFAFLPLLPTDTFTLSAYEGAQLVGSNTLSGTVPAGFSFPEGLSTFSGFTFDNVILRTTGLDFAVDNISVNAATTPEPGTLGIVGLFTALGGVGAYWRRRWADGREAACRAS